MAFIVIGLGGAALIGTGVLYMQLRVVRRRLRALHARLAGVPGCAAPGCGPSIAIEILNPYELASAENRLAHPLIAVAPELVRRIVYKRTLQTIVEQLEARGVRANVKICGGGSCDDLG